LALEPDAQAAQVPGSAAAGDISKSTDKASCDKAGGMWDETGKSCAEKKM
jgi:hypothetical protein